MSKDSTLLSIRAVNDAMLKIMFNPDMQFYGN